MDPDFCWDTEETGCICGNECAPPQWMQEMWLLDDIARQERNNRNAKETE